jgi:DNA ligase D-like protein (predicted 3'-phosphoesterase)
MGLWMEAATSRPPKVIKLPDTQCETTMTIKRTKWKNKDGADVQREFSYSQPDSSDTPNLDDPSEMQKCAEKIREHNRSAVLQPFVIKYHCTKKPHYDFRLGHIGMLKSWAMKTRPSYFPDNKPGAVQVEDHLREYMLFEGVFAEGRPGAGTTMVWDTGIFEPLPEYVDVEESLRKGCLIFRLSGERLKGLWKLVRNEGNWRIGLDSNWQLTKEPDSFAMSEEEDKDLFTGEPTSIRTKRTIKEIERDWIEGSGKRQPGVMLFETEGKAST